MNRKNKLHIQKSIYYVLKASPEGMYEEVKHYLFSLWHTKIERIYSRILKQYI